MKYLKLFENFNKISKDEVINLINSKAEEFGFKKTKLTKSDKDEEDINYISKWARSKGEFIILFTQKDSKSDYEISFVSDGIAGNDSAESWTKDKKWKTEFDI